MAGQDFPVAPSGGGAEPGMDLLYGTTLTVDQASIATGTLATGYRDLLIFITGRSDRAAIKDDLVIGFNGDSTGSNYEGRFKTTGDASSDADSLRFVGFVPAANASASRFSSTTIYVPSHENSAVYKTFFGQSGVIGSTTDRRQLQFYNMWLNASAITSVVINASVGDLLTGTSVSVYGVK